MAKIIWAEPALEQLDEIAEYIALDNPVAANELVARIFKKDFLSARRKECFDYSRDEG